MSATLYAVTFDCVDAVALAGFWSAVLDRPVDDGGTADFAAVGVAPASSDGPGWMFVKVPESKATKNRVHLDLMATDLAAEVERVLALGATHIADREEDGARWATLADPEGNEFDLLAAS